MKISEMTNDQAAEAMIRISSPLGNLCEDEGLMELIKTAQESSDAPVIQTIGRILPKVITYLLKGHKEDLYEIIGALNMVDTAFVAKMNFVQTVKMVRESYDDVLKDFFKSSVPVTKKSEA